VHGVSLALTKCVMGGTGLVVATPVDASGHLYRCGATERNVKTCTVTSFLNALTRGSMSLGYCSSKRATCLICDLLADIAVLPY
jgi:hypothetical protein